MSEADFLRAHDAAFFTAWAGLVGGLAAYYTPAGASTPLLCEVLVDHDVAQFEDGGADPAPLSVLATTVTFRLAELAPVVPQVGGTVTVDGTAYTLAQRVSGSDPSLSVWAVRDES